jgi:F0F1-type ATP synthase membrane subunit b/b'
MNTLIVILQQTCTNAVLEILLLLLVSAIIGYLTAYFYYKAHYTRIINTLEGEKNELKKHIETLFSEKAKLEQALKEKNAEIETLKKPKKKE